MFTRKRNQNRMNIMIRGHSIQSGDTVKYLGLYLDRELKFEEHARMVASRADDVTRRLTQIMPNTGGAKATRRKLLATVPQSIMLYGAPVWANHMGRKGWIMLDRSNRKIGLRVLAAYRTVSKPAVEVLSGMPPPDLMAEYRRGTRIAEEKEGAEDRMMQEWQSRWDQADTGKWTHRLIPDIRTWSRRRHGMMDYHLTQAFTGHGCFSSYLHRFGKLESSTCVFCGNRNDDAEHTLFECAAFHAQRRNLEMTTGSQLAPGNMVNNILNSKANWEATSTYITTILKHKEEEERERQRTN